MENEDGSVTS